MIIRKKYKYIAQYAFATKAAQFSDLNKKKFKHLKYP